MQRLNWRRVAKNRVKRLKARRGNLEKNAYVHILSLLHIFFRKNFEAAGEQCKEKSEKIPVDLLCPQGGRPLIL